MENLFIVKMFNSKRKPNKDEINQKLIDANESYQSRGVISDQWKYFVYYEHSRPIEELYDLNADPQEQKNLANFSEHAELLKKLREKTEKLYQEAVK